MSSKPTTTRTKNAAPVKSRVSAKPINPRSVRSRPCTVDAVHAAVEQSMDVLRYHHSQPTAEQITLGWAMLRVFNLKRPDLLEKYPTLQWESLAERLDDMPVVAMSVLRFERDVIGVGAEGSCMSWIGCCANAQRNRKLYEIWSRFNRRAGLRLSRRDVHGTATRLVRALGAQLSQERCCRPRPPRSRSRSLCRTCSWWSETSLS